MGCDASATEVGLASFYGAQGLTAAHRSLPMGSRVKVLNLDNGRSVIVRIVDRGPFIQGRVIDVSTAAAVTLGFRDAGLAHVRIDRISAETLEASARPARPVAPASDETSSYAICSYGADRVGHLLTDSVGGRRRRCRAMRWDARISDCSLSPRRRRGGERRRSNGRWGQHRRAIRRHRRTGGDMSFPGRLPPGERKAGYGGHRLARRSSRTSRGPSAPIRCKSACRLSCEGPRPQPKAAGTEETVHAQRRSSPGSLAGSSGSRPERGISSPLLPLFFEIAPEPVPSPTAPAEAAHLSIVYYPSPTFLAIPLKIISPTASRKTSPRTCHAFATAS